MGKKSREKQIRREDKGNLQKGDGQSRSRRSSKHGLDFVLLWTAKLATYAALFAPLVLSDAFYFPFVGPKSLYFMGLAEIAIFSWLGLIIISKEYRPKKNIISYALLAFLFVLILSSIFGVSFSNSFWSKFERMTGLAMWLHLVGFFLVISSIFRKEKEWQKLFITSLACALLVAILSLTGVGSTRGGSTIGNSSFLGTYLLFNIFFAVYLFFRKNFPWKIVSSVLVVFFLAIIYKEGARAATLSVLGGAYLLAVFYLALMPKKKILRAIGIILLSVSLLAFLASLIMVFIPNSPVREMFIQQASKSRVVVWEKAWKGFLEKPVFGWGPENFEFVFNKYFNPCMFLPECGGEIWFDRAHNIVFDTLATTGAVGFSFYLGIFIACFLILWKRFREKKISFWVCFIPISLLIAYLVQNLTVFDMISSYLMWFLTLGFIASAVSGGEAREKETQGYPLKGKWMLGVLGVVFFFSFLFFVAGPLRADYYPIVALRAPASDQRVEAYKKSFASSEISKYQLREFFAQNTQRIVQANMQALDDDPTQKAIAQKEWEYTVGELEKSRQEISVDYRSVLRLAQMYNLGYTFSQENLDLAEERGREALELVPTNQQGYWGLAQTMVYKGNYTEATDLVEQSIALEPRELESYKVAVQIAKMTNDKEKAEEIIQRAKEIRPDWEDALRAIVSGEDKGGDM